MFKVVVTDDRHGRITEEEAVLSAIGAKVEICRYPEGSREAMEMFRDADGLLVNLFPMTEDIISGLEKCRVISRYGVGYDNVDVEAATRKGIWVTRVPDYAMEEVAVQAAALMLGAIRNVPYKDRRIREGAWNLSGEQPTRRISGRVLGIVGFGAIGRQFWVRMRNFNFGRCLVYDPYVSAGDIAKEGCEKVDIDELVAAADYISIHAPASPETNRLINRARIARMKPTTILVNTSRGALVEEEALAEALASGKLAYAGLDVFQKEPLPADSPLRGLDNVILSDHAGFFSEEAMSELKTKTARNVVEILTGKKPTYPVNSPG